MPNTPPAYDDKLPIAALKTDLDNPRLPQTQRSQREALETMTEEQGSKLLALAGHIVENGINPADRVSVTPDGNGGYVVLDGNRRLTALKALETPDIVVDKLKPAAAKKLKELAERFKENPIREVACTIFPDPGDADKWVELTHDGESGGAGPVKWSAQQKARYRSRKGAKTYHLQVLDQVAANGGLSADTTAKVESGSYPVSTLQRLLGTPYVREKLGISFDNGVVRTSLSSEEAMRGLGRVVDDIGSGQITVRDLMSQSQRIDYVNGLGDALPDPDQSLDAPRPLGDPGPVPEPTPKPKPTPSKDRPHSSARKHLIPRDFTVRIEAARINDIYIELKRRIEVREAPNAAAVLLRVFLELSLDDYIDRNSLRPNRRRGLPGKVEAVADYMQQNRVLHPNDLQPIRRAAKNRDASHSVRTLHGFVHNRRFSPAPGDLTAIWDTLQLFFEKLWP